MSSGGAGACVRGTPRSLKAAAISIMLGSSQTSAPIADKLLRKGNYPQGVGAGKPFYLPAVLEYLTTEILELAGDKNKSRAYTPEGRLYSLSTLEMQAMKDYVDSAWGGGWTDKSYIGRAEFISSRDKHHKR
ncbi:histone H2A-like [Hippoglossus stenolepis]|uniref:histone H2A-like n=1 Tax=Hippoglossus stenolepis TaxID=195615 RepID=UPI001FAF9D18|nr:histone H2A-like [Hippoglossus stenolepis]